MSYEIGDPVRLSVVFRDTDENLIDPSSVVLIIQAPDDSQTTPTPVHDSLGNYHYDLDLSQAGTYLYRWDGVGTAVEEGTIEVVPSILVPGAGAPVPTPAGEFSEADLVGIDAILKSGTSEVQFADRKITNVSVDELIKARNIIKGEIDSAAGVPKRRQLRVISGSGW